MAAIVPNSRACRVCIIGLGRQGTYHRNNLWTEPPFQVVARYDIDPKKPRTRSAAEGYRTVLVEDRIDLAVIATPSGEHYEVAHEALNAGCHVVVEKPTTLSYAHTAELIETADRRGRVLLTHLNRRWDPDFLAVREALVRIDCGTVHWLESRVWPAYNLQGDYGSRAEWKLRGLGAGVLFDWGPHLLDQLYELFGSIVITDATRSSPCGLVSPPGEEQFLARATAADTEILFGATWNAGLVGERWRIMGTRACIVVDGAAQTLQLALPGDPSVVHSTTPISKQDRRSEKFLGVLRQSLTAGGTPREERVRMLQLASDLDRIRQAKLFADTVGPASPPP